MELFKKDGNKKPVKITNFNHSDIPKLSEDKLKFFEEDLTKKIYIIFWKACKIMNLQVAMD